MTGLCSGIEVTLECGGVISSFFANKGVMKGCVIAPCLFNTCMGRVLSKVDDQSCCGASAVGIKVTDLVFLLMMYFLVLTLEVLLKEAKPLGLKDSWT